MQCEAIYLIDKLKTKFKKEFDQIISGFEESEKDYRHRYTEELYMIVRENIKDFNPEKYKLGIVEWGEKRLALRKELEELKKKVIEL